MTKFLLIDKSATKEFISSRVFQSLEFEQGVKLAKSLKQRTFEDLDFRQISAFQNRDVSGMYFFGPKQENEPFVLFDFAQCDPFIMDNKFVNDHDALTIFFRILRFSIKLWDGLRLNPKSEYYDNDTKTGILFPFPATGRSFRLCIAKSDQPVRQSDNLQSSLLIFNSATKEDSNGGKIESKPDRKVFRLASDAIATSRGQAYGAAKSLASSLPSTRRSVIEDTSLQPLPLTASPYLPIERWNDLLTREQKEFVLRRVAGPERISGAAGCGKTLCLILKCLNNLNQCKIEGKEHHSVFFTHSISTKKNILQLMKTIDRNGFHYKKYTDSPQSLNVTTLQEYCISHLGSEINPTQYIDRDAMDAKNMQLLYILESIEQASNEELATFRNFMSEEFVNFLVNTDRWSVAEMVGHEISIVIKGRASEDLTKYQKLPPRKYGLPLRCEGDANFAFRIFSLYKDRLLQAEVYDSDDIILTAMGQFNTPIWRRRRLLEGFTSIFIDETHLFNLNELSLFHHITRERVSNSIVFSIDRAQAIGDRYMSDLDVSEALLTTDTKSVRFRNIFRYSPAIVDLAQSVTSSGATLFTNFENPLVDGKSAFADEEEEKCSQPSFHLSPSDAQMIIDAYDQAAQMASAMNSSKGDIAIIAFSPGLLKQLKDYATDNNLSVEVIKDRGDIEVTNRAQRHGRFLISAPDYVGGLEFDGVILIGVDKGRVPPAGSATQIDSKTFLEYSAHNQLYVAITRAKYRVIVLASRAQGLSKLFDSAIAANLLCEI